jgi:hypothetical protein
MGAMLVNFPNLNGVLGIKGGEDPENNTFVALITIEIRTVEDERCPWVIRPDRGVDSSQARREERSELPDVGVEATTQNGTGEQTPLPDWQCIPKGVNAEGASVHVSIPASLLFRAPSKRQGFGDPRRCVASKNQSPTAC